MTMTRMGVLLLGWYLLFPPPSQPDAPLSQWTQFAAYDTARECEIALSNAWERRGRPKGPFALCIATNDPRLAS